MSLCCEKNGAIWGKKKAGHLVHQICIWPQHMANPGHLTIVLIRMCRQPGCRAFTVSVSFFSQHADLVLIMRTHLPFSSKSLPPLLSPLISSVIPSASVYFQLVGSLETCRMVLLYRSYWKNINTPCLPPKATGAAHGLPRWWEETVRFVYLKALKKIVWFSQGLGSLTFHRKKKKKFHPTPESLILIQGLDNFRKTRAGRVQPHPHPLQTKQNYKQIQVLSQDQSSETCELLTHFVYLIVSP